MALAASASFGQSLTGTELEIGPAGSNQVRGYTGWQGQFVPARNSGAIGTDNIIYHSNSAAIGRGNSVFARDALCLGSHNKIGWWWPLGGDASLAVGGGNTFHAFRSVAVGYLNYLEGGSEEWCVPENSVVIGSRNYSGGFSSLAVGNNNKIESQDNFGKTEAAAVVGLGLRTLWSNSLIVGQYNDDNMPRNSGLLFAVGNGVGRGAESNALEVYLDGRIEMPRQGDILMGEFGNPGD